MLARPEPPQEQDGDWADRMALEAALDFANFSNRVARELLAKRFRISRMQGFQEGFKIGSDEVLGAIDSLLAARSENA